ncbi:MAG: DUF2007 domain-containing protein [Clostridia bacterium]|nr:DUF2007 domain-containing protein [Clostridia bacterium]
MRFRIKSANPEPRPESLDDSESEEWKLIGIFFNPAEAFLRQGLLANAQIPAVVLDENIANLLPGFTVRLMVPAQFWSKAKKLCRESGLDNL